MGVGFGSKPPIVGLLGVESLGLSPGQLLGSWGDEPGWLGAAPPGDWWLPNQSGRRFPWPENRHPEVKLWLLKFLKSAD